MGVFAQWRIWPFVRPVAEVGGSFRAYPSSTGAPCVRLGTQGTDAFIRRLGDSRKNRPRLPVRAVSRTQTGAERRRSFWSFFLGVQEKGRKKNKIMRQRKMTSQRPEQDPSFAIPHLFLLRGFPYKFNLERHRLFYAYGPQTTKLQFPPTRRFRTRGPARRQAHCRAPLPYWETGCR